MRGGLGTTAAAIAMAFCCAGVAHAAPLESNPRNLTLRLVDLEPGYVADVYSGACLRKFDDETSLPTIVRFGRRHLKRGCTTIFRQRWSTMPQPNGPAETTSGALVLRSIAGAQAGLRHAGDLVCVLTDVCGPGLRQAPSPKPIGDETVFYASPGNDYDDAVVLWRHGRLLGFVTISNLPTEGVSELALGLAEKQQSRMSSPTPLRRSDNDDRTVPLDDPNLDSDVYWLGRGFKLGGLPARRLIASTVSYGESDIEPPWEAHLEYGRDVSLKIWSPDGWRDHRRSKQGRLFLCDRCGTQTSIPMKDRSLTIFAIPSKCLSGRLNRFQRRSMPIFARSNKPLVERCKGRRPDSFVGATRIGSVVVSINLPYCFPCQKPSSNPYNSRRDVRAIAKALRLRERSQ